MFVMKIIVINLTITCIISAFVLYPQYAMAHSCNVYMQNQQQATGTTWPWNNVCNHPDRECYNIHDVGNCTACWAEVCFLSENDIWRRVWLCSYLRDSDSGNLAHDSWSGIYSEIMYTDPSGHSEAKVCYSSPCIVGGCPTDYFLELLDHIEDSFTSYQSAVVESYRFYCSTAVGTCYKHQVSN